MVEPGRGLGLAQRPLVRVRPLFVAEGFRYLDLFDRDIAVEQLIAGTPDNAHRAAANGGLQAVTPGDYAPGVRQRLHSRTLHGVASQVPTGSLSID